MSKTTDLTPLVEAASRDDLLDIIDVSDTADSPEGSSKQIAVKYILLAAGLKIVAGFDGYLIRAGAGNSNPDKVEENDILIGKGAYFDAKYVMMRALQDDPTQDSEFKLGFNGSEF